MKHQCTQETDLDELIGHDEADGFHVGPLYTAMKRNEPLELLGSNLLSLLVHIKLESIRRGFIVAETGEQMRPPGHFEIVYH